MRFTGSLQTLHGGREAAIRRLAAKPSSPPANPPGRRRFGPPWPEESGRRRPESIGAPRASLAIARLAGAAAAIAAVAAATALLSPFLDTGGSGKAARRFRSASARLVLFALGLRLRERGTRPPGDGLIVANHASWTDGLALISASGASFTAYARGWPLVDWLMRRFGTILVPRGLAGGLGPAVKAVALRLGSGGAVGLFPEGTTSFGPGVFPIKPAFFQAAVDSGASVYVAALRYRTKAAEPSPERVAHWVDWTPILVHAYRLVAAAPIAVELRWLGRLDIPYRGRRELAREAEALLRAALS
jgi:1-acyl-sn-glycerol-3-phosphate acyltransferase